MTNEAIDHLAERLFRGFEANDPEAIRACCHPNAIFSKNGVVSGTLEDLLPGWATLSSKIGHHRYTDVRRAVFDGGFVEEHRVVSTLPDGTPLDVVACVVGSVDEQHCVTELREYVNSPSGRSFVEESTQEQSEHAP